MRIDSFLRLTVSHIIYVLTIKILEFIYWDYTHEYCVTEFLINLLFNCNSIYDIIVELIKMTGKIIGWVL